MLGPMGFAVIFFYGRDMGQGEKSWFLTEEEAKAFIEKEISHIPEDATCLSPYGSPIPQKAYCRAMYGISRKTQNAWWNSPS